MEKDLTKALAEINKKFNQNSKKLADIMKALSTSNSNEVKGVAGQLAEVVSDMADIQDAMFELIVDTEDINDALIEIIEGEE